MSLLSNGQNKPKNSSMVQNEKELENHSNVMENMRTNKELKNAGKRPDPVQHVKNEDKR
jgi:hypothetical protein